MNHHKQTLPVVAIESVPIGLKNYGNTCFINAVVQSLANCDAFVKIASEISYPCSNTNCAVCAFKSTILALRRVPAHLDMIDLNLQRFLRSLAIYPLKTVTIGHQEDAHEFLNSMIAGFLTDFRTKSDNEGICNSSFDTGGDKKQPSQQHRPLADLFRGNLCSSIYCYECKNTSHVTEPMMGLEIHVDDRKNLVQAIEDFCKVEILKDANAYACPRCQRNTTAQKSLTIKHPPVILPIQMKRFAFESNQCRKIMSFMEYPKSLDLHPFLMPSVDGNYIDTLLRSDADINQNTQYRLRAFIVHVGASIDKGHYLTYLYQRRSRRWYVLDDQQVRPVSANEALHQYPYLLFYEQGDYYDLTHWEEDSMYFPHPLQEEFTQYNSASTTLQKVFTASPLPNSFVSQSVHKTPGDTMFSSPSIRSNLFSPLRQQATNEPVLWEQNPGLEQLTKLNSRKRKHTQATAFNRYGAEGGGNPRDGREDEFGTELVPVQHRSNRDIENEPSNLKQQDVFGDVGESLSKRRETFASSFYLPSSPEPVFHPGATSNASAHHSAKKATLHPSPLKQPRNSVVIHHTAKKLREEAGQSLQSLNDLDHLYASHQKKKKKPTSLRRFLPSWLTSSYFFFTKRQQREEEQEQETMRLRQEQEEQQKRDDYAGEDSTQFPNGQASRKRKFDHEDARAADYERIYESNKREILLDEEEIDEVTMAVGDDDEAAFLPEAVQDHLRIQRNNSPSKRQRLADEDADSTTKPSSSTWFGMVGRLGRSLFGNTGSSSSLPTSNASHRENTTIDLSANETDMATTLNGHTELDDSQSAPQLASPMPSSTEVFVTDVDEDEDEDKEYLSPSKHPGAFASSRPNAFTSPSQGTNAWYQDFASVVASTLFASPPPFSSSSTSSSSSSSIARKHASQNASTTSRSAAAAASSSSSTSSAHSHQQIQKYKPRANSFFELLIQQLFDADLVQQKLGSMQGSQFASRFSSSAANSRVPSRGTSRRASFSEVVPGVMHSPTSFLLGNSAMARQLMHSPPVMMHVKNSQFLSSKWE
jgi:ubiquitin C-terminal hydrolase